MHDDLTIPDFLNRKINPSSPATSEERQEYIKRWKELHVEPEKQKQLDDEQAWAETRSQRDLTAGEKDELVEIKAMLKTSVEHAQRMASEWVNRTQVRTVQARRRAALKQLKLR